MRYSQAISRRKVALLAGLALVASLLFALTSSGAPQADAQQPASCDVVFVEPGASPVIENGTRTGFTVVCDVQPQTVAVNLDLRAGDVLALHEADRVTLGGLSATLEKTIDVAVPPVEIGLCVEVLGQTHCI